MLKQFKCLGIGLSKREEFARKIRAARYAIRENESILEQLAAATGTGEYRKLRDAGLSSNHAHVAIYDCQLGIGIWRASGRALKHPAKAALL